uniref:PB1 domain-containing protein n=1 Tax=Quercus lobata TaxID=97700 RepID=A0A7N2N7Q4_QUELO
MRPPILFNVPPTKLILQPPPHSTRVLVQKDACSLREFRIMAYFRQCFPKDLNALVSITSDEDLVNLIEEYKNAASPPSSLKIRAFLSPPKPPRKSISSPLPPPIPNSSTLLSKSSLL